MDRESASTKTVVYMKEAGRKINDMVTASRDFRMVILTLVSTIKAKLMVKAFTSGSMEISMMENGFKELNMVTGAGKASMGIVILGNGSRTKHMGTVCTNGLTVINTKVAGDSVSAMDKEMMFSLMATCISASTLTVGLKAMGCISGKTDTHTLESSKMA